MASNCLLSLGRSTRIEELRMPSDEGSCKMYCVFANIVSFVKYDVFCARVEMVGNNLTLCCLTKKVVTPDIV